MTDMLESIARALGNRTVRVAASPRMRGPTTTAEGQYLLTMRGAAYRDVGLVVYRQSVPAAERPVFWINVEGGEQAALVVAGDRIVQQDLPADWIASDYLDRYGEDSSIRFVALNPRRTLRIEENGDTVAESGFLETHPVTSNLQAMARFRFAPDTQSIELLAVMVHQALDAAEARSILSALDPLLDEPAPAAP